MSTNFRKLYEKGEFKDLLYNANQDDSDEGKFWQMVAYFNLGLLTEARFIVDQFDRDFSSVSDPDLRKNFETIASHLVKEGTGNFLGNFDQQIFDMFDDIFDDPQKYATQRGFRSAKNVDFNGYFCKYVTSREKIPELRRQYDLLQAIQGSLSVDTPNPLSFRIGETHDIAAFIYRKIPGNTLNYQFDNHQVILDLLLEVQQLYKIDTIRKHTKNYDPEVEQIMSTLTREVITEEYTSLEPSEVETVLSFIQLSRDHLKVRNKDKTFVHGDLFFGNIIGQPKEEEIVGLIDFERAWFSDPWLDFAKLNYNNDFLRDLLELYNTTIASIDLDYIMAKVLLYRGFFILRRMAAGQRDHFHNKITSWIIKAHRDIVSLLN